MVKQETRLVIRQFDVVHNTDVSTRHRIPYLIILQVDVLGRLPSVVVAPLYRAASAEALTRITFPLRINDEEVHCLVHELAAVQPGELGALVDNFSQCRDEVIRAIDLIFSGI